MRTTIIFLALMISSCGVSEKNHQPNKTMEISNTEECKFYRKGIEYFNRNYHGDYMNNGSRDTAITIFEKAVDAGCQEYDLYDKLYFCYEWEADYSNAEKYISLAINSDSSKHELYYWKGEMNMHLAELNEALNDYQKYISFSDARHLQTGTYRIGAIYYALGDEMNAQKYMDKAVKLNNGKELRDFDEFGKAWGMIK